MVIYLSIPCIDLKCDRCQKLVFTIQTALNAIFYPIRVLVILIDFSKNIFILDPVHLYEYIG